MSRHRSRGRLPTPDELMSAPELAILGALEAAIDLAIVAIIAAQPELQASDDGNDAVSTAAADRADGVIVKAQALAAAIAGYRTTRLHDLSDLSD
jgi:hypothetical protein